MVKRQHAGAFLVRRIFFPYTVYLQAAHWFYRRIVNVTHLWEDINSILLHCLLSSQLQSRRTFWPRCLWKLLMFFTCLCRLVVGLQAWEGRWETLTFCVASKWVAFLQGSEDLGVKSRCSFSYPKKRFLRVALVQIECPSPFSFSVLTSLRYQSLQSHHERWRRCFLFLCFWNLFRMKMRKVGISQWETGEQGHTLCWKKRASLLEFQSLRSIITECSRGAT